MICIDLEEEKRIKEVILKDLLTSSAIIDEGLGKVYMFDLDTHEDKVWAFL